MKLHLQETSERKTNEQIQITFSRSMIENWMHGQMWTDEWMDGYMEWDFCGCIDENKTIKRSLQEIYRIKNRTTITLQKKLESKRTATTTNISNHNNNKKKNNNPIKRKKREKNNKTTTNERMDGWMMVQIDG